MGDELASGPPPTYRTHVLALTASEGYVLDPLLETLGSDERPLFTIVDVDALAPGGDPTAKATALAEKLAADKAAGIEAKIAAAEAAAAAAAEAKEKAEARAAAIAAGEEVEPEPEPEPEPPAEEAEGEEGVEVFKDTPPAPERSADAYMILKNFPLTAEDSAAMGAAGVTLDTVLNLEMDSFGLGYSQGTPPAEPAEGEEPPVPEPLPPSALIEAIGGCVGAEGEGLEECVVLTVGAGLSAERWANLPAIVQAVADTA
jgi:hypothetical protein